MRGRVRMGSKSQIFRFFNSGYAHQGRTGPPGCLAKARWAGAAVGRFDKNDNFKNFIKSQGKVETGWR